jgi:hypothetical protein
MQITNINRPHLNPLLKGEEERNKSQTDLTHKKRKDFVLNIFRPPAAGLGI